MSKPYLAESLRAARRLITDMIAATDFTVDPSYATLGAKLQGEQGNGIVIYHVGHLGNSMHDGRTHSVHEFEYRVHNNDALNASIQVDELWGKLHGYKDTTGAPYGVNVSSYFYPDSCTIDYEFQDEYIATLSFRIDITEE